MIICGEVGGTAQWKNAAVFNASAVLSGWISQFSPALCGTRSPRSIQRKRGDTYGVTGDARPFKRSSDATRDICMDWTGEWQHFERLRNLAQHHNNRSNGVDTQFSSFCPFYNASGAFCYCEDSSVSWRPPPSTALTSLEKQDSPG